MLELDEAALDGPSYMAGTDPRPAGGAAAASCSGDGLVPDREWASNLRWTESRPALSRKPAARQPEQPAAEEEP